MIQIEQSQHLQIDQCINNSNPQQPLVVVESSKELVTPQNNQNPTIEYSEGNSKLTIRLGTIIIKKLKQTKMKNAKVYSNNQVSKEQTLVSSSIEKMNMIFSVKDHIQELNKQVQVISIENSRINIYALKKIVNITSNHLTSLRIENCTFYESDNSAIFEREQSSNNKMLRELSFAFQIKALFLPEIDNIEIILKKSSSQESNANSLECKDIIEEASKEQKMREDLAKEYDCHQDSYFVEFELNLKSTLEKKYEVGHDQEKENQVIQYILNGNQENKDQIEQTINANIVRDINDHIHAFTKYLKGSLLANKSILKIKEYSLEDPIASNMIYNMINKYRKDIKTIVFKQTGTIPFECFRKVIDCMVMVKNLESVAFFDSQPQSNCYWLLRELLDLKSFKYFVLNRSFFDIAVYKQNVFGIEMIKYKEYESISFSTPPKHYAFYILDQTNMLEFTPYRPIMKDLFLEKIPNLENLNEYNYSDQKQQKKYQFELLIEDQEKYDLSIQKEINKFENKELLVFQNIQSEQIFVKYRDKLRNKEEQFDQLELENDITTLIKHSQPYTIGLFHLLIYELKDLTLQNNLLKTYKLQDSFEFLDQNKRINKFQNIQKIDEFKKQQIISSELLVSAFLFEQGLMPCKRQCFVLEDWLVNFNVMFPLQIMKKMIMIEDQDQILELKFPLDPKEMDLLKNNKRFKGFHLTIENNQFSVQQIIEEDDKVSFKSFSKHSCDGGVQEVLKSMVFSQFLNDFKSLQNKRNDLEIQALLVFKENTNILLSMYFQILSENGLLQIKRLSIYCSEQEALAFSFPLKVNVKVKELIFLNMKISNNLFEEQPNIEELFFCKCNLNESFNINNFKEIQSLTFSNCYLNCDQFFKNIKDVLGNSNNSSSSQNISKISITIQLPVNSEYMQDCQVSLNKDTISYIMENQNRLSIKITNLDEKTKSETSNYLIRKYVSEQYQQPLINKILGMNINLLTSPQTMDDNNNQIVQNAQFENRKIEQKFIDKYHTNKTSNLRLQQIYKQPGKVYSQLEEIIENEQNYRFLVDYLPKCCVESFKNYSSAAEIMKGNQNLKSFIQQHLVDSDELCLFKTSIYQDKYSPRKIKIKILTNFLVSNILVYNFDELDNIEELNFEGYNFTNNLYLKFIDFMIQSAPNLKRLTFSYLNKHDSTEKQVEPFQISIGNCPNLKKLTVKLNCLESFQFFKCLTIQFDRVQLEQLKFSYQNKKQIEKEQILYEQNLKLMIEQAKHSLLDLFVFSLSKDIIKNIQSCPNLKKLKLLLKNEQEFQDLKNILSMESLEQITIYTDTYLVNYKDFQNLLIMSENEHKHLKMISLKNLNRQNKGISTCYRRNINNSNDQVINQSYQILQIKNQFFEENDEIKQYRQNYNTIPLEEFLTKYNNNTKQSFDHILGYKNNLTLPYIQLYLDKSFDFKLLNQVFEYSRDSLELLSFNNCQLDNNSLNSVDFCKLPNTINYLCFDDNKELTSLAFLKSLVTGRDQLYQKITLRINTEKLPFSEIFENNHYFKKIYSRYFRGTELTLLQHLYENDSQKLLINIDCFVKICHTNLSQNERKLFYNMVFKQKIDDSKFSLFSLSPLQIVSSDLVCKNKNSLIDILNKQITNNQKVDIHQYLGNKLLLYLTWLLRVNQKYLFGYRKNYHWSDFNIYKTQPFTQQDNDQKLIITNEHDFYDYLLLTQMQDKSNLKYIQLPLTLYVSFQMMHNKQINTNIPEEKMIEYLSRIPASEITLEDMSIQFIKIWYVINSISSLAFKTTLKNVGSDAIYNTSIGNYLTQNLHRNNFIRILLSGNSNKYRFDETVHLLAQYFEEEIKNRKHEYLLVFFPLYLFVCVFGVIFFSLHYNVSCGEGISWYSYITYAIYGIITFYFELLLFKRCLSFISHLIPSLEIDLNPNFIISFINFIKQSIIDTPWINQWYMGYSYSFFQSQIQRFDNFTNVGFLYSTFECGNYVTFSIALAFMTIPFLYSVYQFTKLIIKPTKKYELPTSSLDTYYRICSLIEFRAVSDILDLISPSNVICLRGRLFNARIINFFIRIVCESMPLVIIQIYNLTQKEMTSSLVLSLILSIITFLSMLMSLLTITPSTLNQEDFTQMNEKKIKSDTIGKYEERLQRVEDETFALRFYKHLKELRSQYLKEKQNGNVSYDVAIKYKTNKKYFESFFNQPMMPITNEIDEKEIE